MSLSTLRLHHVGIVVPTAARATELMQFLGLEEEHRGAVEIWHATCIFTRASGASQVEFVVPDGGPLAKFNRGVGGLHHVALAVASIRGLSAQLAAKGIALLEPEPVQGAGNFLCNFLGPAHTRGIIVEFVEELG